MTRLYKLTERYNAIEELLDSEIEGISKEDVVASLGNIKDDIEEKISSIGKLVLELKSQAESIKAEEDRLSKRKSGVIGRMEWLKSYLLVEMQTTNILKVKRDVITVSVQNSPPSAEVANLELIPIEFIRIIPEKREADKKAIIEHFKDTGEIVAGVDVVTNRKYIVIR